MRDRLRIAIATVTLLVTARASASAQTFRETGSVTIGTSLVWVRATNAGVVQLFVGRGFRDAFAPAHQVDATTLQRWVDSVRALPAVSSRDSAVDESQVRASVLSADVTMLRRVGGPFSGLRLLVSGEDPIAMPEPTARDFLVVLDSAARVARAMSTSAPVATVAAGPEPVLPAPSEPMLLLASRADIMPLPMLEVPAPPPLSAIVAPPVLAPVPDTVVAPHVDVPADKLIHTPLGPFTIPGALLADRDKEAQYCYTQLGLKYNPDLRGEITVKLSLGGDGAVQDAVVTKRNWQGISAGEVEACVRALAHDWSFPASDPTIADGAKLLTFSFTP
jgi:hypothetical protein